MIRIEIEYLTKGDKEVKFVKFDVLRIHMMRICSKEHKRDIYLDEDQFLAAFTQEMPEKLFVYHISPKDVGKMVTIAKG